MWILFAFGSAFFAGITAVLAKCGIKDVDSDAATAVRTVVVLVFSWVMVFVSGSEIGPISAKTWTFLILSGLATGASWLCYFKALQLGDVNKVAPIDKSSTVLTMLLAFILLGEPLGVYKVISMVLIAIGTYLMLNIQKSTTEVKGYKWLVLAVMSAVFASLTAILGKVGIEGIDSTLGTAIRTVVVLIMAWMIVFVTGKKNTLKHIDRHSMLFLILSGASWLCYYRALKTGQAGVVVPIDKLSIIVTIAFSYIVLKEKLSAKSWLGLILITAGTLLLLV
jgi:transporter family protein